jgi:hypothetical protein
MYRIIGADGREYGPISADQMRQWIAENRANAATRVLAEGATEWRPLGSIPEFTLLFASSVPKPAPGVYPGGNLPVRKTNGFAVAGLVLGIISLTAALCCYGLPFNLLGLIFSIIGLAQIKSNPEQYSGRTMAIIGLALCIVSFFFGIVLFIIAVANGTLGDMTHHGRRL